MDKAIDTTAKALASLSHHVGSGKDQGPSKSFQNLIRMIGEAKTKHEEDRIIRKESQFLKEKIGAADVTSRQMRELLIRLIYCEMLGVECSWGYIHAIKMTQNSNIMDKRIGYLAASLCLHENHELNMLLVNTIQRDLKSSNILLVSMALIIICKLIGAEMIPPLLPLVQEKLLHPKELVRKKAVMVMHHFFTLSPSSVSHLEDDFRRSLSDQDPGVMEAALILFHDMAANDPHHFKDLVPSFTNILSQVVTRKLPADFDYHGVPAPWIQMRLLRIFAILGADDLKVSEQLYPVIEDILASAECNSNIGQAISYECIRTVASIYPNAPLIEKAAQAIGRFVTAPNNNWKYLGINSLAALVQINPKYAADHQLVVIDCLDDPDDTLKRKTLDLLYKMTNPSNVAVITDKLIAYLRTTRDDYIRSDLVAKITQLAERFAPDNLWFIQTMNAVFELGGSLVRKEVAHNLMRLIAEGTDDEETDAELRLDAVSSYLDLLDKPHLPDILVKIICWVVGEYGYLMEDLGVEAVLEKITTLLEARFEEEDTCGWVVTAITKLVAQLGHMPETVQSHIAVYLTSTSTDVQQRCSELVELSQDMAVMQDVLPMDASCEDLEVDSSLSFLDSFVSEALAKGASAYKPPHQRVITTAPQAAAAGTQPTSIKFEPYALPQTGSSTHSTLFSGSSSKVDTPPTVRVHEDSGHTHQQPQAITQGSYSPKEERLSVKERKWGKSGYNKDPTPSSPSPHVETTPTRESENFTDSIESTSSSERGVAGDSTPSAMVNLVQASAAPPSHEEVKRKQLANQLFGGLSGPSRAPRSKQRKGSSSSGDSTSKSGSVSLGGRKFESPVSGGNSPSARSKAEKTSPHQQKQQQQQPAIDLLLDLQDVDFSSPGPVSVQPTPATSGATPLSNLMADMDLRPHPQPQQNQPSPILTPNPQPPPSAGQANLLDLFDTAPPTLDGPTSAPPPTQELSLLDAAPLKSEGSLALTLFETPVSSVRVPEKFASFPIVQDYENKELSRDANLRISLTKVLKTDQLVLVFNLTNQKQDKLSGVTLSVTLPTSVKGTTGDGEPNLTFSTDLTGFANASHVICLVPTSPALNVSLRGELSYRDPMATSRRLFFDTALQVSDLIRPLEIKTPEFGKKWGTLSYEKKLKLPSSKVNTPAEFMQIMKTRLNFHPVEIIGMEGITAGSFLPSTPCLAHGKIRKGAAGGLEFWVRTPNSLLTDSIAKLAQTLL